VGRGVWGYLHAGQQITQRGPALLVPSRRQMSTTAPDTPKRSAHVIIAVLGLGAVLGWGLVYVPSAWLVESWPPLFAAGARVAIAGAVLLIALVALRRPFLPGCSWSVVFILAATQSVVLYGASYIGIAYDGAGLTSVLQNTDPLFVAVLAVLVLGESMSRPQWMGMGIGLLGTVVVAWKGPIWPPDLDPISVLVIGGAIAWAVGTVAVAKRIRHGGEPVAIAGWQMVIGGPVLVLLSLLFEGDPTAMGMNEIGLILFIAIVGSALPFAFFYLALARGGAATVSSWFLLVPVVGVLTAWPALGETPSVKLWVGLAMVCGGLWMVFRNAQSDSIVRGLGVPLDFTATVGGAHDHADDARVLTDADRQWVAVLSAALDDRRIDPHEVEELNHVAEALGLSRARTERLAGFFMADHVSHALRDGEINAAERSDLERVGTLLGLTVEHVDELIDMGDTVEFMGIAVSHLPEGTSARFCWPLMSTVGGVPITPEQAQAMAEEHGLKVVTSLFGKADVLVAADIDGLGALDRLRRRRGARLMVERTFWMSIDADVD
jgi:drug/metabolite transporter (DMT)-like permease